MLNEWEPAQEYLKRMVAEIGPENLSEPMLDICAGPPPHWPKEVLLPGRDVRTLDSKSYDGTIDYVMDAEFMGSLGNDKFGVVFLMATLEHVIEPAWILDRCKYIMQPGGYLFVSVPYAWRYHPHPEDYWRWMPAGFCILLASAGFQILDLTVQGSLDAQIIAERYFVETGELWATCRKPPWPSDHMYKPGKARDVLGELRAQSVIPNGTENHLWHGESPLIIQEANGK